jgi:hypothetical protein
VRRVGAASAATKPRPAAAPRHEVRGERRGEARGGVALPALEGAAERARVGGGEGVSTAGEEEESRREGVAAREEVALAAPAGGRGGWGLGFGGVGDGLGLYNAGLGRWASGGVGGPVGFMIAGRPKL